MKLLLCRTIILYLCVLFAMRLMGKRQLGELQPEELVSTILISNLASISIESEDVPITASLIPLFLIAALELLGSVVSFRSQKFFNFLSGRPKTVILDGKIDQNALRMLRLTTADLMWITICIFLIQPTFFKKIFHAFACFVTTYPHVSKQTAHCRRRCARSRKQPPSPIYS